MHTSLAGSPAQDQGRSRWVDILLILALPWLYLAVNDNWFFAGPGLDSWRYLGLFHDYVYLQSILPGTYPGSRLPWIVPGYLIYQVFPPILAHYVLHFGLYYVAAFSLYAYLSRSDVTWNPSVVSQCKASLYCPTTEEYILPVIHGNDRVEWFIQLSDEIRWEVEDRDTGKPRAKVVMKAGDVAAMPGDIRHQGYSPKRSMLLVWENASPEIPELIRTGKASVYPVDF